MLRAILAVLVGVFAWAAAATVLNLGLRMAWPDYAAAEPAMRFTLEMMFARLLVGVLASVAAGLVAALVARRAKWPVYIVVLVLLLVFIPIHHGLWARFPAWYHLFFLASLAVFTLLGARRARARR